MNFKRFELDLISFKLNPLEKEEVHYYSGSNLTSPKPSWYCSPNWKQGRWIHGGGEAAALANPVSR
jgi:hypothetical protein